MKGPPENPEKTTLAKVAVQKGKKRINRHFLLNHSNQISNQEDACPSLGRGV